MFRHGVGGVCVYRVQVLFGKTGTDQPLISTSVFTSSQELRSSLTVDLPQVVFGVYCLQGSSSHDTQKFQVTQDLD